jgi:hypothetical protein
MEPIYASTLRGRLLKTGKFIDIPLEKRVEYIADNIIYRASASVIQSSSIMIVEPWEECEMLEYYSKRKDIINEYLTSIPRRYVKAIVPLLQQKFPDSKIEVNDAEISIDWSAGEEEVSSPYEEGVDYKARDMQDDEIEREKTTADPAYPHYKEWRLVSKDAYDKTYKEEEHASCPCCDKSSDEKSKNVKKEFNTKWNTLL